MIVTGISATNFLKYNRLALRDLPERGIIGVRGLNESGKSSIGETLCYGLFGRTFSLGPQDLDKLIHWSENEASVTVSFRANDGQEYEVGRMVGLEGENGARLCRKGDPDNPIARGCEAVTQAVSALIGFDYEEYLESFYLAQREIIAPQPHSSALKSIAGLSVLERAGDAIGAEIDAARAAASASRQAAEALEREIADSAPEEGRRQVLEREHHDLKRDRAERHARCSGLEATLKDYREANEHAAAVRGSRGFAAFLRFLSLLVTLGAGAGWYLLERMGEHPLAQQLAALLGSGNQSLLPISAGVAAVLFLVFWTRVSSLNREIASAAGPARELGERLRGFRNEYPLPAGDSVEGVDERAFERVVEELGSGSAVIDEAGRLAEQELERVRKGSGEERARIEELEQLIENENARAAQVEELRGRQQTLRAEADAQEAGVRHRELAIELVRGACNHTLQRFNGDLRNLVARILPLFTDNRYEHLQVDEELVVRVFSNKKRDYMDLAEISAGTQRQIMLALRLALAERLAHSAVQGAQFIFLDEPSAFFDEERTRDTLKSFSQLGDQLTQVWVVAQHFPSGIDFALELGCDGEVDELVHPAA